MKEIKIKRKSLVKDRIPTYDLTIKDSHHYILKDGTISHNTQDLFSKKVAGGGTGPEYGASIILFLTKAQLKDKASDKEPSGIIVTAKPNKNRFARPKAIKFHISFNKGMNPYVGLQDFISWETCGIEKGKFINKKEYEKLTATELKKCYVLEKDDDGVPIKSFLASDSATKLGVKHLGETVSLSELFTPKVMTLDVLKSLDEVIQKEFSYGDDTEEMFIDTMQTLIDDVTDEEN